MLAWQSLWKPKTRPGVGPRASPFCTLESNVMLGDTVPPRPPLGLQLERAEAKAESIHPLSDGPRVLMRAVPLRALPDPAGTAGCVSAGAGIHVPSALDLGKTHPSDNMAGSFVSIWCPPQMLGFVFIREGKRHFLIKSEGRLHLHPASPQSRSSGWGILLRPHGEMSPCLSLR